VIQISTVAFSLLVELLILLSVVLGVWFFQSLKRSRQDRAAAAKVVEQVRHQSDLRVQETGSFLEQKYQFEGDELKKAVQSIDRAEKKFIQKVMNMYLKRLPHELEALDASMAELIDAYKDLTPASIAVSEVVTEEEPDASEAEAMAAEVETLRESNARLNEELAITKQTMGNMIAEFGNMFGGGQDSSLEQEEVLAKVNVAAVDIDASTAEIAIASTAEPAVVPTDQPAQDETAASGDNTDQPAQQAVEPAAQKKADPASAGKSSAADDDLLDFDEGIDELMDGIDLSEDN